MPTRYRSQVVCTCIAACGLMWASVAIPAAAQSPGNTASSEAARTPTSHASEPDVNVSYEGFSQPISDVRISTEEVGLLVDVPVKLGQYVREGELLAQLRDDAERAALAVARAQAAMDGEIEAAKASRMLQVYRVNQLQQLMKERMAGDEELRRAKMELAVADARVQVAEEQKKLRGIEVQRLELQVESRQLLAPFDGVVAEVSLGTGASVTPSRATLMQLIRVDVLIGVFNVPATKSFAMKPGMATQVYFRAARQTVNAVIDSIAPAINGESGTVQVQVRIENPDGHLHPGDRCSMRVSPIQQITRRSTPSQR
ncbi:RND family efflux transporter, MFP subunit [Neorhodopirellula lusitana]|uniref:RND family efflux transporter, MFP subunit n=1 Tax=Neorhodopirellula lusitana TaxID=445327 RepID=A0ABY1QJE7_9BACT|nr:efflux RND transporter periplasmic adaptor subunit [Neorhodopirellula lusitana]SMP69620.1 RND family efflux transporter, MFP subunit [Neorhodopirellula lusitana]